MTIWDKYKAYLLNEGLTQKTIKKRLMCYNVVTRYLDLGKAKRSDIEKFISDLNQNNIKKQDGEQYSGNSKQAFKKFLKNFYKWYKGKTEFFPKEVSWLKTKIPKDEKPEQRPVLEVKDAVKLANSFNRYEYRILTLLLFDSGFRAQEALSCTKKDLTYSDYGEDKKCFWLKCNESKTFIRNIPVPLFTAEIKTFYESAYYQSLKDDDPLFSTEYANYLKYLKIHSQKLFNIRITPHCLRHSSATYYARELSGNVPQLAMRYGWSYSAQELQTYVRSSGAYNKESAKIVIRNEIAQLKEENTKLWEEIDKIKKAILNRAEKEIKAKKH